MSYLDVARVWLELKEHKDCEFMLDECVGHVLLSQPLQPDGVGVKRIGSAVLLKCIFDYQRTVLRCRGPSHDRIIPLESTLRALDGVISAMEFVCRNNPESRFVAALRTAFMSGFRSALLFLMSPRTEHSFDVVETLGRLYHYITRWFEHDQFHAEWVSSMLRKMLTDIPNSRTLVTSESECNHGSLDIPDRPGFVSEYDLTTFIRDAASCISNDCKHWYRSSMALYDARLSLVAAYLDSLVDSGAVGSWNSHFEHFPDTPILASVAESQAIGQKWADMGRTIEEQASVNIYNDRLKSFITFLECIEPGSPFDTDPGTLKPRTDRNEELYPVYQDLVKALRRRREAVSDSAAALDALDEKLWNSATDWIPRGPDPHDRLHGEEDAPKNWIMYVVNCPDLHQMKQADLLRLVEATPLKHGKVELENYGDLVTLSVSCELHTEDFPIKLARKITPLEEIPQIIQQLRRRPEEHNTTDPSTLSRNSVISTPSASVASDLHRLSDPSLSTTPEQAVPKGVYESTTPTSKKLHQRLPSWGPESSNSSRKLRSLITPKGNKTASARKQENLDAALSTDASCVVVWSSSRLNCWTIREKRWCPEIIHLNKIVRVAASRLRFAAVSEDLDGHNLSLFDSKTGACIGKGTVCLKEIPYSMAFSGDGDLLAVSGRTKISLFNFRGEWTDKNNRKEITLVTPKGQSDNPESQALSFSSDTSRVVVATRFPSGEAKISIIATPLSGHIRHRGNVLLSPPILVGPREDDLGITSVPCLHKGTDLHIAMCLSTAHSSRPAILSLNDTNGLVENPSGRIVGKSCQMNKIQAATAVSGATQRFVFINHINEVFTVDHTASNTDWQARKLPIHLNPPKLNEYDRRRTVKLSTNALGHLVIFYISRGSGCLNQYDMENETDIPTESVPLDIFYDGGA